MLPFDRRVIAVCLTLCCIFLYRRCVEPSDRCLNFSRLRYRSGCREPDTKLLDVAAANVQAVMEMSTRNVIGCPTPTYARYQHLQIDTSDDTNRTNKLSNQTRKYFFALDLHECADRIQPLLSAMIQSMRFLGPQSCALSIVEGRSRDGTFEILATLRKEMDAMGVLYYLSTSEDNPLGKFDGRDDRVGVLADLRNQALQPLLQTPALFSASTSVIFLNDVVLCMEDILELLNQHIRQGSDMMCAMDWTYVGPHPSYYDVWVGRGMTGDTFFDLPIDGSYDNHWNLFWNDRIAQPRFLSHEAVQVFSCWNGAVVLKAEPFVGGKVQFRSPYDDECYQGEPQLLSKDLWKQGYGKIAVTPTVNLAYDVDSAYKLKRTKGFVSDWTETSNVDNPIEWEASPPDQVKCMTRAEEQSWLPWDQALQRQTANATAEAEVHIEKQTIL